MEHVAPDAAIFNGTNISLAREEGIITASFRPTEVMAELRASLLGKVVYRAGDRSDRNKMDQQEDRTIGFMHLARPVPDPDTRFESLAQDPLRTGIPVGRCSAVNPASSIPLHTGGCLTTKYGEAGRLLIIPVSI